MPDNYLYLGLLAAMFPRAVFIHCRRDLRDVALSCWVTDFRPENIPWASDPGYMGSRFPAVSPAHGSLEADSSRDDPRGRLRSHGGRSEGVTPGTCWRPAALRMSHSAWLSPHATACQDREPDPGSAADLLAIGGAMEELRSGAGRGSFGYRRMGRRRDLSTAECTLKKHRAVRLRASQLARFQSGFAWVMLVKTASRVAREAWKIEV